MSLNEIKRGNFKGFDAFSDNTWYKVKAYHFLMLHNRLFY